MYFSSLVFVSLFTFNSPYNDNHSYCNDNDNDNDNNNYNDNDKYDNDSYSNDRYGNKNDNYSYSNYKPFCCLSISLSFLTFVFVTLISEIVCCLLINNCLCFLNAFDFDFTLVLIVDGIFITNTITILLYYYITILL